MAANPSADETETLPKLPPPGYTDYHVVRQVARSNRAKVMLARRRDGFLFAIKAAIAPEDLANGTWARNNRLLRHEAECMRLVSPHSNIVQVLNVDINVDNPDVPGAECFKHRIFLEWADAGSLNEFMELEQPMSWITQQLCPGMASALQWIDEKAHMVHQSIGPRHVLVKRDGNGQYVPLLYGFGRARGVAKYCIDPLPWPMTIWYPDWIEDDMYVALWNYTPALDIFMLAVLVAWVANTPVYKGCGLRTMERLFPGGFDKRRTEMHRGLAEAPQLSDFRSFLRKPSPQE